MGIHTLPLLALAPGPGRELALVHGRAPVLVPSPELEPGGLGLVLALERMH